jgi:4-hydroxy-tetrahydrodipicolinate reductase
VKIALIGYGKMGREVEQVALSKGHSIVARRDPALPPPAKATAESSDLEAADVCIEFTTPSAVLENIRTIARTKKPLVVGTTGWYEQLAEAKAVVAENGTGLVYAPNFSLGVNLFYRLVETAAELFNHFEDYDVFGSEIHHRQKVDSPSGTARKLGEIVLKNFKRKKAVISEPLNRSIRPDEFHLVSARAGHFPGIHSLTFDSAADSIELTHTVRFRSGFALGALLAAQWIASRRGFYSFEQVLKDLLSSVDKSTEV